MAVPAAVCLLLSLVVCRGVGRRRGGRGDRRAPGAPLGVILAVDSRSPVAPYEQLRQQVTALVLAGGLARGDRLPSIRQLANDLGIAGGTVARAYRELESDGVVTHAAGGTAPSSRDRRAGPRRRPSCSQAARSYADRAAQTGAGLEDALTAVRVAFAAGRTA